MEAIIVVVKQLVDYLRGNGLQNVEMLFNATLSLRSGL
jgi:hypothetical protein